MFFIKKHELSLCDILVQWWIRYFRIPLTFQIQLPGKKCLRQLSVFSEKSCADALETNSTVQNSNVEWLWLALFDKI